MARHVPEFALVTGAFLGVTLFVVGAAFTPNLALSVTFAGAVLYGFVGYAVVTDDDPTGVLPPWPVLVGGAVLGLGGFAAVLVTRGVPPIPRAFRALVLALGFALPAAAYYVHFVPDSTPVPPAWAAVLAPVLGVVLAVAGLVAGATLPAAAAGLLVALAGALYANARAYRPSRARTRLAVGGGVVVGAAAGAAGVAAGAPPGDALVVALAVVLGPAVYYALTAEMRWEDTPETR